MTRLCGIMSSFVEDDLDRLAGPDDDHVFVVRHPFQERADPNDADAQLAEFGADLLALLGGQQRRQAFGELEQIERVVARPRAAAGVATIAASTVFTSGSACSFGQVFRGKRLQARERPRPGRRRRP